MKLLLHLYVLMKNVSLSFYETNNTLIRTLSLTFVYLFMLLIQFKSLTNSLSQNMAGYLGPKLSDYQLAINN